MKLFMSSASHLRLASVPETDLLGTHLVIESSLEVHEEMFRWLSKSAHPFLSKPLNKLAPFFSF